MDPMYTSAGYMTQNSRRTFSLAFVALLSFAVALRSAGCGKNHAAGQDVRVGPHSVTLSWTASKSPGVGYYVYRTSLPARNYTKLNSEPLQATQYSDAAVEAGHTYTYYVTAVDSKNVESPASIVITATVPSP
jgi:hypothetical protein